MIQQLADMNDTGIMYHDKHLEMTLGGPTSHSPDQDDLVAAPDDTTWNIKYIDADRVWLDEGFTGDRVVIGHIDSGVYLSHPDLINQLWTNVGEIADNGLDDDGNGFVDDVNGWDFGDNDNDPNDDSYSPGHGTHTAGTLVGDGSGGTLTGIAPGARLLVTKVVTTGGLTTLSSLWAAEQYCIENGAQILTMSMGTKGDPPVAYTRNDRINVANIRDVGVAFFVAAGNEHLTTDAPLECRMTARIPSPWVGPGVPFSQTGGAITIGATQYMSNGILAQSSQGPARWDHVDPWNDWPYNPGPGLIKPDVVAPGQNINSLAIPNGYSGNTWSGTSMACPHVSGIAALMLEKNPSLSPAGLDSLIQLSALPLGEPGKDNVFGSGQINALAAIQGTTLLQQPDLVVGSVRPDPAGDGVIIVGQTSPLAFELVNNSWVIDAKNVVVTLSVVDNPYVTVVDTLGVFPDISSHGGTVSNYTDPFVLAVAEGTPQGYEFTMLLSVTEETNYERVFDVKWFVGLPEWRTHDSGNVYLTVTDQGIIGHMTMLGGDGYGMGIRDEISHLFLGSFWAGTDASYICNRDYTGNGNETYEWQVQMEPSGRVAELNSPLGEQSLSSIFTDSGHTSPRGLTVQQNSHSFGPGLNEDFVILEYILRNSASEPISPLYTGVYCDFDIFDSDSDEGGTDSSRNLVYMYEADGPYFGIVFLGLDDPVNLTLVSNSQYMYPTLQISDFDKIQHLQGSLSLPVSTEPSDWSILASSVVDLPANNGTAVVAYALVYGENLADLQLNTDAAIIAYRPTSFVEEQLQSAHNPILHQNHPNPFNPQTNIRFSLTKQEFVKIEVFDVSGRKVRLLVNEVRSQGDHSVRWDGYDDEGMGVSSGVYFCRLTSTQKTQTTKMTIVR